MTIRRLDTFFRTQITLDQPQFFNSITNIALAPLQRLIGQNQFQSLKDKAGYVSQITPAVPSGYVATLFKVVVFVCDFFVALVLTPIGIAARHLSFWSPQIDRAYSHAFLLQLSPNCTPEEMESACIFIQKMTKEERTELLNELPKALLFAFLSVPAHYDSTREYHAQCDLSLQKEIFKNLPISTQVAFLSLDNAEFTKKHLREIPESEYFQLMPHLSTELIELYNAQHTGPTQASQKQPNQDDLDALLDDTLDEFMSYESPNSLSVQSATVSSFASVHIERDQIERLLARVPLLKVMSLVTNLNDAEDFGQETNRMIELLNLFFYLLLQHSDSPKAWLEQETKFYSNCHPFAASYFLITHLDQATCDQVNLNQKLIAEWKDNYQKCVLLLKKQNLNLYNETEFPFSKTWQFIMEQAKMLAQNPAIMEQAKMMWGSLAQNPRFESSSMAQDPQMKERANAMQGMGIDSPSNQDFIEQVQPLVEFFLTLDQVLNNYPQDAEAVEAWLKSVKDEAPIPSFFCSKFELMLASFLPPETINIQLKSLYESCSKRLMNLGLQKYVDEIPSAEFLVKCRQNAMRQKEIFQLVLSKSLSVLRPLSTEIKKLNFVPEKYDTNREVINKWIISYKKLGYFPSFTTDLDLFRTIFGEVLDKALLDEFTLLLSFCRERLLKLGLNAYVEEIPTQESSQKTTAMRRSFANSAAEQEPITISTGEIEVSLLFFQKLDPVLQQHSANVAVVEKWLNDTVPKLKDVNPFSMAKTLNEVSIVNLANEKFSAMIKELIPLSKNCCHRLQELGLQKYINEDPHKIRT
jgi:hypothetical protein